MTKQFQSEHADELRDHKRVVALMGKLGIRMLSTTGAGERRFRGLALDESLTDRNRTANGGQPFNGRQGERRPPSRTDESNNNRDDRELTTKDQDDHDYTDVVEFLQSKNLDDQDVDHVIKMLKGEVEVEGDQDDPDDDPNDPDQAEKAPQTRADRQRERDLKRPADPFSPASRAAEAEDNPPPFKGRPRTGGGMDAHLARIGLDAMPTQSQQRQSRDHWRQQAKIARAHAEIRRNVVAAQKRKKLAADAQLAKQKQLARSIRMAQDSRSAAPVSDFYVRYPRAQVIGWGP